MPKLLVLETVWTETVWFSPSTAPHWRQRFLASHTVLPDIFRRLWLSKHAAFLKCLLHSSQVILALPWMHGGMAEHASHDASHLCWAPLTPFVKSRAHLSLGHGRRHVRDDMIVLTVIQQVDPPRCGYLAVKHDAVAPQTWIHHYSILRQMALQGLYFGDRSSTEIDARRL